MRVIISRVKKLLVGQKNGTLRLHKFSSYFLLNFLLVSKSLTRFANNNTTNQTQLWAPQNQPKKQSPCQSAKAVGNAN